MGGRGPKKNPLKTVKIHDVFDWGDKFFGKFYKFENAMWRFRAL